MVPKRLGFIALVALSLVACRPKGVLSSGEMEDLLYDLHYTEAVLQEAGYAYGHESEAQKYYYATLKRHGVTQAQFDSSIVWYTAHPTRYDKIYPRVLARIEKDFDRVQAEEAAEKGEQGKPRNTLRPLQEVMKDYRFGLAEAWYKEEFSLSVTIPYLPKE